MGGLCLVFTALEIFALKDLTPDAVTMATTSNPWTGEVAWLTDRRTPDTDPEAAAVQWNWIGLLAVSWPDTVRLGAIRVYLGELHTYRVFGYLGGGFSENGLRLGEELAVYGWEKTAPEGVAGWYEIPCESETAVDNISFQVIGGATVYEIQFLSPAGTAIRPFSLGAIKRTFLQNRQSSALQGTFQTGEYLLPHQQ